jgi:hypothetical protein
MSSNLFFLLVFTLAYIIEYCEGTPMIVDWIPTSSFPFLPPPPPPLALLGDSCECQVCIHATRGDSARFLIRRRIDIDTFLGSEHHRPKRAAGIVDNNVNSFECPLTERKRERASHSGIKSQGLWLITRLYCSKLTQSPSHSLIALSLFYSRLDSIR